MEQEWSEFIQVAGTRIPSFNNHNQITVVPVVCLLCQRTVITTSYCQTGRSMLGVHEESVLHLTKVPKQGDL